VLAQNNELGAVGITLPLTQHFTHAQLDDAIQFSFPHLDRPLECAKCAILATTNTRVAEWNELIPARTPGEVQQLLSVDRLADAADMAHPELVNAMTDAFLSTMNDHNVPPHTLRLKEGDICLLMRNLSNKPALTNNTRVIVHKIEQYTITVQIISQNSVYRNTIQVISRIYFKFTPKCKILKH